MAHASMTFVVFGFASTHDALTAEQVMLEAGVDVTPIPAPALVSSLCGIALRIAPADEARAEQVLDTAGVRVAIRALMQDMAPQKGC